MTRKRVLGGFGFLCFVIYEVLERAEFIRAYLPKSVVTHGEEFMIAAMLVILGVFVFGKDERHAEESGPSSSNRNENTNAGNAAADGGNAVAKIADNLYFGVPNPVPVPKSPPVPRRRPIVNPKKAREIWANTFDGNTFWEPEEKDRNSARAFVAEFRNEPINERSIPNWHGVQASIFYLDESGEEVARVGAGAWIKEIKSKITLPKFESRELIVAIRAKDAWIAFDGDTCKLKPEIRRAKIILHGESTESDIALQFVLELDLTSETVGRLMQL